MANFTLNDVNDAWGFFGEMRGSVFGQSTEAALALFNHAVNAFGGDPDVARQFLNSQSGRHYADALTFLLPSGTRYSTQQIKRAIDDSREHKHTRSFFAKDYPRFKPYEDGAANEVVERLLGESGGMELEMRELGYAPLSDDAKQSFQGAGPLTVSLDYDGNGFSASLIYDMETSRFEVVDIDANSVGSATLDPAGVVQFTKDFLAAPSMRRLKFLFTKSANRGRTDS